MTSRATVMALLSAAVVVLAATSQWVQGAQDPLPAAVAGVHERAVSQPVTVAPPASPDSARPASIAGFPQSGRWAWDPVTGIWFWEIIVPAPVYYPFYYYPYPPLYPRWWVIRGLPPGKWTYEPNPDYEKGLFGMFEPPKPPKMTFPPGVGPSFPWARKPSSGEQAQAHTQSVKPRPRAELPPEPQQPQPSADASQSSQE
ncbi:MAG TPA: hypothetical protein VM221_00205 [Armatimonadota bacterium]|nr:hypothetical protein [Armatimonadota bacterium]